MKYIKNKYKLLIGERTSEDIKLKIGTVYPHGRDQEMDIRGQRYGIRPAAYDYDSFE